MSSCSLQSQVLNVVAATTIHNFIRQEAQRDWLFKKYGNDELILIDSDNEEEENKTITGFMPSHLISEMNSFRDSLANLIQRTLE